MAKDERDLLDIVRDELNFIEKGGYGRSVRTPWQAKILSSFPVSMTLTGNSSAAATNQKIEISATVGLHNMITVKL
jgi:hypothetical protein